MHYSLSDLGNKRVAKKAVTELTKITFAVLYNSLGKTAAYMLPILERLIYRPQQASVTRVLILTPTRELAIQVFKVCLLCDFKGNTFWPETHCRMIFSVSR